MGKSKWFRPDPNRSVFVRGSIDQELVDSLFPAIARLQDESRKPITVYIDSLGGHTDAAHLLLRLLRATDQDGSPPCRVVTVATGIAASAAADLLSAGDYALAYDWSDLHIHGVRVPSSDRLTIEDATGWTAILKSQNEHFAYSLAERCIGRFILRFLVLRTQFSTIRQDQGADREDIGCFVALLKERVENPARKLLDAAYNRFLRYQKLLVPVSKAASSAPEDETPLGLQARLLKGIIDHQLGEHEGDGWHYGLRGTGLADLQNDFHLLLEYFAQDLSKPLELACDQWASFFMDEAALERLEKIQDESARSSARQDEARKFLQPIWFLFVALCHGLQRGENRLTSREAYWLGLIDEVIGATDLPNVRQVFENQPEA